MTWVKLDDQFHTHPKIQAAGRDGRDLWLAGLCYSSANLTDGIIPKTAVPIIAAMAGVKPSVAKRVVDAGLWEDEGATFRVHDYLEHQSSKEKVEAERARTRQRKERFRERQRNADRNGGGNGVPNGQGTLKETGSRHPLEAESEAESSSAFQPPPAIATSTVEEDLQRTAAVIAQRKLQLRRDQGERDPNHVPAWLAKVEHTDRDRLRTEHERLRAEHPDWTAEQLADELDPVTAADARNYLDADESAALLDRMSDAERQAVAMPESIRR